MYSDSQMFFRQWLRLEHMPEIVKNPELYPGFDAQLVSDLRESLELFLDELLRSPEVDFRRLFQEETLFLNGRLAASSSDKPFRIRSACSRSPPCGSAASPRCSAIRVTSWRIWRVARGASIKPRAWRFCWAPVCG